MKTISNVISGLRCCFDLEGHLHCSSCPYNTEYTDVISSACDRIMAKDAVEYLEMYRKELEKDNNGNL